MRLDKNQLLKSLLDRNQLHSHMWDKFRNEDRYLQSSDHESSGPIGFWPAFSTFRLFVSGDAFGSFLMYSSNDVSSSPSCASEGCSRLLGEMGDCVDLESATSEARDSFPLEVFTNCDSGPLETGFATFEDSAELFAVLRNRGVCDA